MQLEVSQINLCGEALVTKSKYNVRKKHLNDEREAV